MNISFDPYVIQLSFTEINGLETLRLVFFVITFLFFGFFIYFIVVLLIVYFTTPHVQENARYILFAHMLINDTLYLSLGLFLAVVNSYLYIPLPICYILVTLAATTYKVTPYNLAIMSLERYIAICFPLRHIMLCTAQRSYLSIAVMWFVGLIPNIADFTVLVVSVDKNFFSQYLLCRQESLLAHPVQGILRSAFYISSLVLVVFVISFTYIKVIVIARKTKSKSSSASKASRTLMLHAIQLALCLLSLTISFTESYNGKLVRIMVFFNFLLFMCLPRLLSPLIYGLRDEVFSKCIKKMYASK